MNVPTQPVVRVAPVQRSTTARPDPGTDQPGWGLEEPGGAEFEPRPVARLGWRLWLGVVAGVGLVSVGLLGPFQGGGSGAPARAASAARDTDASDGPIRFTTPAVGATIEGAVVQVRGTADEDLGRVQLGIVVGDAVLGWTVVRVDRAGPVEASIPIFAPPVSVEVELLVVALAPYAATADTVAEMAAAATERRSLRLRPGGPIGIWPAKVVGSGAATEVVVAGCAPIGVGRVQIRLVGRAGGLLAASAASVARDDTRPGSAGGYSLGVGSFVARLAAGRPLGEGPVRVEVDWRDEIGGEWGTSIITIIPDAPGSPGI